MGALAESKKNWIIGAGCSGAVSRLWERYHSLSLAEGVEGGEIRNFAALRLSSLGVPKELASTVPYAGRPELITERKVLNFIQDHLRDEAGRPLQKILSDDINSRVLTEVSNAFPKAKNLTEESIALLEDALPWSVELLDKMIPWVVPIYHEKYNRPFRRGFSHMRLLGTIFTTFVERSQQPLELRRTVLAIDLAHELGHQILMLYQLADKVIETPLEAPVYSSVRKTNRPAIMALHACVAAAYMMEVCWAVSSAATVSELERQFAVNSLLELRLHQKLAMESLRRSCRFTAIGSRIMNELDAQLVRIAGVPAAHPIEQNSNLSYFGLLAP